MARLSRFWLRSGADTIDPILSQPYGLQSSDTEADGTVVVRVTSALPETGTLYYITSASAFLDNADIIAGSSQAVTVEGQQVVSITGLTASNAYYIHYLFMDSQGSYSNAAVSDQFTTDAGGGGGGYPILLHHHYQVNIGTQ
jgi:hypothetical protein